MTAWVAAAAVSLLVAVLVGWALPAWAIRALLPSLETSGRTVANYRGRPVTAGLGVAWLVAAVGFATLSLLTGALASGIRSLTSVDPAAWFQWFQLSPWGLASGFVPVLLIVGAFAFGLVDDVFGEVSAKGFRGHLGALREGRLTTGALKLLGVGVLALGSAWIVVLRTGSGLETAGFGRWGTALVGALTVALAGAVIALSANTINLLDLRPGRALKGYLVLATVGLVAVGFRLWAQAAESVRFLGDTAAASPVSADVAAAAALVLLVVLVFGPVVAVWRLDLGERGMLGDAGANAMGALAGYLVAWSGNIWFLAVAAAVLLALNLASERVSFSRVIDELALLRWIDGLGRLPADDERPSDVAGMTRDEVAPASSAGGAGTTDDVTGKDGGS